MYESILVWMPAGADWIYILVVVLVLFGAKKLPELARGVGKSMGEFKKARDDFENEIKRGEEDSDEEATKPSSEKSKDA